MKNPALTPEEAQGLKFPRLMEVWDSQRERSGYRVVEGYNGQRYVAKGGIEWQNAAEPPAHLIEAMREQFAFKPQRMLVWDGDDEYEAVERIVIHDLGLKARGRYIVVALNYQDEYKNGNHYSWARYRYAKPIPETDPVAEEIADLKRRLAELEGRHKGN